MSAVDTTVDPSATSPVKVYRIEIHPADANDDPIGRNAHHEIVENELAPSVTAVRSAAVFLIETTLSEAQVEQVADELLADPVNQMYIMGAAPVEEGAVSVEAHYLPGVMDPVANSTEDAIVEMFGQPAALEVRSAMRYDLFNVSVEEANNIGHALFANTVIQSVEMEPYHPDAFVKGQPYEYKLTHVNIRDLDEAGLEVLSREGHLFLSLDEMKAIQNYYIEAEREPTDIELESLAQTWSEHCVHKTLKSTVSYKEEVDARPNIADFADRPGHEVQEDGTLIIDNVLKSCIANATIKLQDEGVDWLISIFEDNAGIIEFDDEDGITFKVETHNHPSALEPYGGAATGIGGCIRDTMGTGLAAKPVANTDVFCVADPEKKPEDLPKGVLHPRRVLKRVVAGVRDYGNRMGIPTVNGAVYFDDRYLGNPLVFAGSVGIIPKDKCFGTAQPGDRIIAMGGRTGRDGIHGATFSSAELTDSHQDEFSHAVQIGNAITEKKALDVILQARDYEGGCLYTAITDCGAGGFSSAVGEMGEKTGAYVELDKAPLKYDGLSYTEIWISEAQERMVMSVPAEKVETLRALAAAEDVEICDLGYFGTEGAELILNYKGNEVGRMAMSFLHDGIPTPTRDAVWGHTPASTGDSLNLGVDDYDNTLLELLGHRNIASKHWVVRQYDHEVQGGSVVKPLVGKKQQGPSDAAVIRPKLNSKKGVCLSNGLATAFGDIDPYWMTLASIDEAVRNAVCTGARPDRIAILDNFCWANCAKPHNFGALVRAAEACYDGALAYRTPFISGKDSLNNEFKTESGETIAIPPTLLISAMGIVEDTDKCVTMDAKHTDSLLLQVGLTTNELGGSHLAMIKGFASSKLPKVDLKQAPKQLAAVAELIAEGRVASAHDCSEGGMLVAAAEMAFAGDKGLELDLAGVPRDGDLSDVAACFAETPSRILLEVTNENYDAVVRHLQDQGVPFGQIGRFCNSERLLLHSPERGKLVNVHLAVLLETWLKPLDW